VNLAEAVSLLNLHSVGSRVESQPVHSLCCPIVLAVPVQSGTSQTISFVIMHLFDTV
jgi:hypothetical protein